MGVDTDVSAIACMWEVNTPFPEPALYFVTTDFTVLGLDGLRWCAALIYSIQRGGRVGRGDERSCGCPLGRYNSIDWVRSS